MFKKTFGSKPYYIFYVCLTVLILSFYTLGKGNDFLTQRKAKNIMFLVHTESIGGKGVYEIYHEMKKAGHTVKIVATPSFYYGKLITDVDKKFISKFEKTDVILPCGEKPYQNCTGLEQFQFDYIFVQNPYDTFNGSILDPNFIHRSLKKITKKLAFIVYGPHIFHQDGINDKNLKNIVDLVFVDSESTKKIYVERYDFPKNRVIVSGYQTYHTIRENVKFQKSKESKESETILWMPRWTLSFKNRDTFEGGSTFLNYHYFFYNHAKDNQDKKFIIRPHALLTNYAIKNQHLSHEDFEQIWNRFNNLKNVRTSSHIDNSLVDDVLQSDIVIADGTSAIAEAIVADKPIIYLSNGWNNEFNSNDLSKELQRQVFIAYDPEDILKHMDTIRKNNYSPIVDDKKSRESFKMALDPVKNPAHFIAQYCLFE